MMRVARINVRRIDIVSNGVAKRPSSNFQGNIQILLKAPLCLTSACPEMNLQCGIISPLNF